VYALVHESSGTVYRVGRAKNLVARAAQHARMYKGLRFVVLHRTDSRLAQRGLEEMAHARHTPLLDKIRPISLKNPMRQTYRQAARHYLRSR
jgi:hypothetical protein